jgi:hypothetical protein
MTPNKVSSARPPPTMVNSSSIVCIIFSPFVVIYNVEIGYDKTNVNLYFLFFFYAASRELQMAGDRCPLTIVLLRENEATQS